MVKIIYLSAFIPRGHKEKIAMQMKKFNFNSADAFSYSIFSGFVKNLGIDFRCINIAPIGAFPRYNNSIYYKEHNEVDSGVKVESVGYSTFYTYMYYSIYRNLLLKLMKGVKWNEKNVFVIYSINLPVLKAVIKFRNKYSKLSKIVLIVPDLLEDCMAKTLASKIKMKLNGDICFTYKEVDGFVFLTEQMNEKVKTSRPYCIVEGMYNINEVRTRFVKSNDKKTIFYSGMLYEKFGVKTLVDAFLKTKNSNYKLQICGCGELEGYVIEKAIVDSRIEYLGLIAREKVLEYQSKASLLINPRKPEGEFTKYSFPSKNIEYLVSGTPVLLYELEGIPSEYYKYCFHLSKDKISIDDLYAKIEDIFSLSTTELAEKAQSAAIFIKEEKNAKKQVSKILRLIEEL